MPREPATAEVHFVSIGDIEDISFNPALPNGLLFSDEASGIAITIKPADPERDQFRNLVCTVYLTVTASEAVKHFISSLLTRSFVAYEGTPITLPYSSHGRRVIDETGNIADGFGVPFELYPPEVQSLCDSTREVLLKSADRFLRLLRWQQNVDGPHWIFRSAPALYWKIDGEQYHIVGSRAQEVTAASPAGIEWKDDDRADFEKIWLDTSSAESVAHELLREARSIQVHSPRSSFLIATSALEVGVKAHVAYLLPDSSWLLSELPAPPIHKILRTYVPQLYKSKGRPLDYWDKLKPIFKRVEGQAKIRNTLTHTGNVEIKSDMLHSYIRDVTDLLYLFDVLRGHEWAKHNLSGSIREMLGWPKSRRTRHRVTLRTGGV